MTSNSPGETGWIRAGRHDAPASDDDHSHRPVTGPPDAPAGNPADTVNVSGAPTCTRLDRSSPSRYFTWMRGWWTQVPPSVPGHVAPGALGAADRNVHSVVVCCTGRTDGFHGVGPSTTMRYVSTVDGSRNVGIGRLFDSGSAGISAVPRNRCTSLR